MSIRILLPGRLSADAESSLSLRFCLNRIHPEGQIGLRTPRKGLKVAWGLLLITSLLLACDRGGESAQVENSGLAPSRRETLAPAQAEERIERANGLIEKRQYQKAVNLLRPVVSQQIVPMEALEKYGQALLLNDKPSLALWALTRAAEGAAPESDVAYFHARANLAGGDAPAAIKELDRLIAVASEMPRLRQLRSQAHMRELDYERALEDLEILIELVPSDFAAREAHVDLLTKLELFEEAREAIAELGQRIASSGGTLALRGRHCASAALFEHQHGEDERARRMLLECLERYPTEPDVLLPWVLFLDAQGEIAEATSALETAISGPGRTRLRLRIALAGRYAAGGNRDGAARELNQAAEDLDSHRPLLTLADYRVAWEDLEGARDAVYRAVEKQTGHAPGASDFSWSTLPSEFRFAFGDILIRAAQVDEVTHIIESLDEDSQEVVYPILLRARLSLEQGEPETALPLFEESFKYWPSNVGARYLAGRAAMEIGEFDLGITPYRDAFRADPAASDAGLVLARMQLASGQVGAAADSLSTLLGQIRDDPDALRLFANLASRIGAFEVAKESRDQLGDEFGWQDQALADQASEVLGREGRTKAIEHLESAGLFEQPDHYESLFLWFRLMTEGGEVDKLAALDRLRAIRATALESAGIELAWAYVHRSLGEPEQATAAARLSVERDPMFLEAGIEFGRLLLDAGEWDEAEAAFQRVLDAEPSRLGAAMGLADVAMGAGRDEESERRYRKALVEHPWHGRAARALARIGFDRGDFGEQTLVWARWAARFNEGDPDAGASLLAELRLARAEPGEAAAAIAAAIESGAQSDPRLLYLMGRALIELGDTTRAAEAIDDALRLGDFTEASEARDLLSQLRSGVDP